MLPLKVFSGRAQSMDIEVSNLNFVSMVGRILDGILICFGDGPFVD